MSSCCISTFDWCAECVSSQPRPQTWDAFQAKMRLGDLRDTSCVETNPSGQIWNESRDERDARNPSVAAEETSLFQRGTLASMTEVTRILSAIEQGDAKAARELLPLVYDELRKLAAQ